MQNPVNIPKKTRTFTLVLTDNDDTLIDGSAKINLYLLKHLKEQVKPDYLAIITGRYLATVPHKNLNPDSYISNPNDWKNQLAFDEVYQNLANHQDSENPQLTIDFVSTPYDLAHSQEDDWQGFYQTKMKPFEVAVKENTSIDQPKKYWEDNASNLQTSDEEQCLEISLRADLSKQKYAEIVNAFQAQADVKKGVIDSHPSSEPLANKHLQTLDFLRKLARTKSLNKENYDELEIAIYDDSQDNIEAMKNAILDFEKLTGIRVKIFSANIIYGEGDDMFKQTQEVCAKLTTELASHRKFYDEVRLGLSSNSRDEGKLFYRLKNNFKDQTSTSRHQVASSSGLARTDSSQSLSPTSLEIDKTRYDFKLRTNQESNPISQAIKNNNQQDYFSELAKIILATKNQFNITKPEGKKLDLDDIAKIITMAIALKGFSEKSDQDLQKNWQAIEGNSQLSPSDLRRFGAIFQNQISSYALTGNPNATRPEVGMRLKRIDINFLPEIMKQAQIQSQSRATDSDIAHFDNNIKNNLQKLSELKNTRALQDQSSSDQVKDEFYDQLLIPKNSPLRPTALSVMPRVLTTRRRSL
ncbi:MAG: hypothetical protein RL769_662 [Pseudomonadota bacterium]